MSELLKQREAFLKRAQNVPVIENKSAPVSKRPRLETSKSRGKVVPVKNFHLIHKIVTHMKNRHLQNELLPLSLDEVLEECNSTTTVSNAARLGLEDALPKNPKLRQIPGDVVKYCYKPSIEGIRDKKSFLQFLERHYHEGLGGVTKEMVQESLPKADKILKYHNEKKNIHLHTRPDKKTVIFFNDRSLEIEMDETFQKLWRSITVESVDEDKIAEYLAGQGITFADDPGIRKVASSVKRKKRKNNRVVKTQNTHIQGLKDFPDK